MVYLADNCTGGGTNFPRMKMPSEGKEKWCRFLECEEQQQDEQGFLPKSGSDSGNGGDGVTFKPIKGNAIFWENLRPDGTGYPETWHAAFPVTSGTKIGLNIWSWYQPPRWGKMKGKKKGGR